MCQQKAEYVFSNIHSVGLFSLWFQEEGFPNYQFPLDSFILGSWNVVVSDEYELATSHVKQQRQKSHLRTFGKTKPNHLLIDLTSDTSVFLHKKLISCMLNYPGKSLSFAFHFGRERYQLV